jgi:hypothetical protein
MQYMVSACVIPHLGVDWLLAHLVDLHVRSASASPKILDARICAEKVLRLLASGMLSQHMLAWQIVVGILHGQTRLVVAKHAALIPLKISTTAARNQFTQAASVFAHPEFSVHEIEEVLLLLLRANVLTASFQFSKLQKRRALVRSPCFCRMVWNCQPR